MNRTPLKGGRLKSAGYDTRERRLEIEFVDHTVKVYKSVPEEVWRRLLSSPNPASYHEDRIAEEYPVEDGARSADGDARKKLDDLFGG